MRRRGFKSAAQLLAEAGPSVRAGTSEQDVGEAIRALHRYIREEGQRPQRLFFPSVGAAALYVADQLGIDFDEAKRRVGRGGDLTEPTGAGR